MKKIALFALAAILIFALAAPAMASEAPTAPDVRVDGSLVAFPDAQPFIDASNRTLMPVRFVTEALGAKVDWDGETRTAIIVKNGITVKCQVDNDMLIVIKDGKTATVKMDTKAVIKDGRTFVPIRFVVEALDGWINYSAKYNTVQLSSCKQLTAAEINRLQGYYDMDETEFEKSIGRYDELTSLGWKFKVLDDEIDPFIFANQNEKFYREPNYSLGSLFDYVTGEKASNGNYREYIDSHASIPLVADAAKYSLCMARNASEAARNPNEAGGIKVDFKTDASLMNLSRSKNTSGARGIISISYPMDLDAQNFSKAFIGALGISNPQPGRTYTFDAEVSFHSSCGYLTTGFIYNLETRTVIDE